VLLAVVDAVAGAQQLDDFGVMEEAVEQDAGGDIVAEHCPEVLDGAFAGKDGGAGLVAAGEDLQQVLSGGGWQGATAEVVEDKQVDGGKACDELLASARGGGLGEVEGGAVADGVAGLDGAHANAHADVRLAEAGRTEDESAAVLGDEAQGREVEDELLGMGLKLQSNSSRDFGGGICACLIRRWNKRSRRRAITLAEMDVDALIATGRWQHGQPPPSAPRGRIPANATARERMARKTWTQKGRADYARRKAIVEPVFGQMMILQGARYLLLRGKDAARSEWRLLCACHNLRKLFVVGGAVWRARLALA
jgi:hypothetical protein